MWLTPTESYTYRTKTYVAPCILICQKIDGFEIPNLKIDGLHGIYFAFSFYVVAEIQIQSLGFNYQYLPINTMQL